MIALPQFAARINIKPLAKADDWVKLDAGQLLKSIRKEIMKSLKAKIMQGAFSKRARDVLSKGLKTVIGPNSLTVYATHPAFMPLVKGMKSQTMTWLLGAKAPIPIVLDTGEIIFRTASARSMRHGGWKHPGHQATTIVEQARREAREVVKRRIRREIQKQLRTGLKAATR